MVSPFAKALGATPVVIGVVASAFAVGAMVFKLVSAPAIDAFRRKYVLLAAITVIAVAFAGYALSSDVPTLMTFRLLQGAGQAFTATTCITLAADALPREKIAAGIGIFAVASGAARMIGEPLALRVHEATSFASTFAVAVVIMAGAAAAALNIRTTPVPKKRFRLSFSGFVAIEAVPAALLQLMFMLAWSCVNAFVVVVGMERGLGSEVGLFATVYGLGVVVSAPLGGRLVDRFGYLMMVPMLGCFAAALSLVSVADDLGTLLVAAAVGAFGYGAAGPVARSMAMSVVPAERRGSASSTLYLGSDLGQLVGPVVGGMIAAAFGYRVMFRVVEVFVAGALVVLLLTRRYVASRVAAAASPSAPGRPALS
jgi:MFS family permease